MPDPFAQEKNMAKLSILALLTLTLALPAHAAPRALKILESHKLPVPESSGLCWGKDEKGNRALIAVGDTSHTLYFFEHSVGQAPKLTQTIDVAPALREPSAQSQWESVYADQSGKVYILPESPEVIHVYDTKTKKLFATLKLEINEEWREKLKWDLSENSQSEGIILLKNGHVLVVKEKRPMKIVEFAPESNQKPAGYNPDLSLEKGGEFPASAAKTRFVPVHFWEPGENFRDEFPDASGLNIGHKSELYLLSDQGSAIGKIGTLDPKKSRFEITELLKLPKEIKKAEGMVFDEKGRLLISTDAKLKKDRPNFFVLSLE